MYSTPDEKPPLQAPWPFLKPLGRRVFAVLSRLIPFIIPVLPGIERNHRLCAHCDNVEIGFAVFLVKPCHASCECLIAELEILDDILGESLLKRSTWNVLLIAQELVSLYFPVHHAEPICSHAQWELDPIEYVRIKVAMTQLGLCKKPDRSAI
jgi:hypothetical protein